ncbi:Gfo/Idh/MocA family oxidoreductase [Candidatus Pseudothioglobus singularis]|nr:Gfo/Idh/MocA family oxidoreductase [Candidatus Pseudothioglobus singularis]
MLKRILFIGLGGAGQRHLRLFKENLKDKNVEFIAYRSINKTPLLNPDFSVNQEESLESVYGIKVYDDLDEAIALKPDLAVISTPSSMHIGYAQLCAEKGINIFVEKPLSHSHEGYQKLYDTVIKKKLFFQVGFQRRFHPCLKEVNDIIKNKEIGSITNAIMTVASYIPFWHPYEDFKQLYACRNDLGGGVLLTEIHEFDLCVWYFGKPTFVTCVGGTYSNVGLDVEDTVHVILDYNEFSVQINLTFWQKHAERSLFIAGEKGRLSWNQDENIFEVENYNNQKVKIKKNDISNDLMFDSQVKDILLNHGENSSTSNLIDSFLSLSIVLAAKKSMKERRSVKLDEVGISE